MDPDIVNAMVWDKPRRLIGILYIHECFSKDAGIQVIHSVNFIPFTDFVPECNASSVAPELRLCIECTSFFEVSVMVNR